MTALVAAFVCLFPQQPLEATAHALAYFGCAAALLYRMLFLDARAGHVLALPAMFQPAPWRYLRKPCHAMPCHCRGAALQSPPRSCFPHCTPAAHSSCCSLAAELAAAGGAKGPGSLRVGLLDNLWSMGEEQLLAGARVSEA